MGDSGRQLQQEGFEVTYIGVDPDGLIDLEELEAAIREDTSLVSVMMVNNETGVLQPVKEIGAMCRRKGVFFHTDAAQAVGKLPIDVNEMNIDLLSLSGHKIYGPKGVGALYSRRRPRVRLEAVFSGGGQERGLRSGTVPAPLAVGLGAACAVAEQEMERDAAHVARMEGLLREGLMASLGSITLNGSEDSRYKGILNISFAGVEGESLLMALDELAHTSLRFGLGRFTTEDEVRRALDRTVKHVTHLRNLSPLWEMMQEGIDLKSVQWSQH